MEILLFTIVAIALYFASDFVLERIEVALGRRLEHRNVVFFIILLSSALASFALIRHLMGA